MTKAQYELCDPCVNVDGEAVGWDVVTFIHELTPRALHLLQRNFATLWRLSNR